MSHTNTKRKLRRVKVVNKPTLTANFAISKDGIKISLPLRDDSSETDYLLLEQIVKQVKDLQVKPKIEINENTVLGIVVAFLFLFSVVSSSWLIVTALNSKPQEMERVK